MRPQADQREIIFGPYQVPQMSSCPAPVYEPFLMPVTVKQRRPRGPFTRACAAKVFDWMTSLCATLLKCSSHMSRVSSKAVPRGLGH